MNERCGAISWQVFFRLTFHLHRLATLLQLLSTPSNINAPYFHTHTADTYVTFNRKSERHNGRLPSPTTKRGLRRSIALARLLQSLLPTQRPLLLKTQPPQTQLHTPQWLKLLLQVLATSSSLPLQHHCLPPLTIPPPPHPHQS